MRAPVLAVLSIMALLSAAVAVGSSATAQDLVGTWRLLRIDVEGAGASVSDPFYNQVDSGLLIYDQSGWVSVQIVSSPRPKLDAPSARQNASKSADERILKARLLDTYYAYFGTWEYDPKTSTVTHQVKSALYSGEAGARYAQHVTLDGNHMVFTRVVKSSSGTTIQRKLWERINSVQLPAPLGASGAVR